MAKRKTNSPSWFRAWVSKHWKTFIGKPTNGAKSLASIQITLDQIRVERLRLSQTSSKMVLDTKQAKEAVDQGNAVIRPHN